jgi:hypothetical protein
MTAGVWVAAALAGLLAILRVAAWLERLVALPALYPEPQMPEIGVAPQPAGGLRNAPA